MKKRILIIGACGQIGTELTERLRRIYAPHKVIASDIREGDAELMEGGPFEVLDAMDYEALEDIVINYEISEVYLMAAMLSAQRYCGKISNAGVEPKYELAFQRAKSRQGRQDRKGVLALEHCGLWTYYSENQHPAAHYRRANNCVWYK